MKEIKIGNKIIGKGKPVFIIAEAGVNHNGRLDLALRLVDEAAKAGADAIKFQTFKAGEVVTKFGKMASYQKKNIGKTESQVKMLQKLEFDDKWYKEVIERCKKRGIIFFSTPHGSFDSVNLLQKIKTPMFKFGSGDLTNLPVLQYAAKFKKPMILGTGMATMVEIKEAIKIIKSAGNEKIIVLHCTTNYPCPFEEVNLRAMQTMMRELNVLVGYSDHTLGTQVPVMASTLGAVVIEKHFTLDNNLPGPDHKASANPEVFKKMVDEIREVKIIMGSFDKKPLKSELQFRPMVRKSLVTLSNIAKGEMFNLKNIGIKRPGTGLAPKHFWKILGLKSKRDLKEDSLLTQNDF